MSLVEIKQVDLNESMIRAIARQAEAERERRAKVINAEGEFQASERLKDAALVIEDHPIALQLRYLQTLLELGSSQATTIVFPARNDSWIVGAASRSYYADLLAAGVNIHEYEGGLLHTKSLTVDGELALIGSANMDRRSFDLNYENNILFYDPSLAQDLRRRQQTYLARSHRVDANRVGAWSRPRRLWNNSIAIMGPLL